MPRCAGTGYPALVEFLWVCVPRYYTLASLLRHMTDLFLQWFRDPTVQGLLLSPLIGAVMGLVLTAMVQPANGSAAAPQTVSETRVVFVHRVKVERRTQDDGSWIFPAGIAGVLLLTWGYAKYAEVGILWWVTLTLTFISFNVAAAVAAVIRRELLGAWLAYVAVPLFGLFVSLWLAASANDRILPGAVEAATQHGFVNFYFKVLSNPQRHWLLTQALGVLVGVLATLLAAARLTHYIALSNQRGTGLWATFWRRVAWATRGASGALGLVFGVVFYALSSTLVLGVVYAWFM
jgi:hypothetical protein